MPNWVINRMSFKSSKDFLRVINRYCTEPRYNAEETNKVINPVNFKTIDDIDDFGDISFDFNRVIKMPAVLDISSSSLSSACLKVYDDFCKANVTVKLANLTDISVALYMKKVYTDDRTEWDKVFAPIVNWLDKASIAEYMKNDEVAAEMFITNVIYTGTGYANLAVYSENYAGKSFTNISPEERCRIFIFTYELGKLMSNNREKYGSCDWYSWRCKNWGTKWNASEEYVSTGDLFIDFSTAWSTPENIFRTIAEQNPDISFEVRWADEDFGSNTGWGEASEGDYICDYYENMSQDAYETAAKLWDVDLEEEGYIWDDEKENYVYKGDEDCDEDDE